MCFLATERWVLRREPCAGTAAASIFHLSPNSCCRNVLQPCSRIPSFFFFSSPRVISRDLRFWPKLPPARASLAKTPFAEEEPPEDAPQMTAREDGSAQSRNDPGGHLERSGNDGGGLGFSPVHPASKRLFVRCNPEPERRRRVSHRRRTFGNLLQPLLDHQPEDGVFAH